MANPAVRFRWGVSKGPVPATPPAKVPRVSWSRVASFRLWKHHLDPGSPARSMEEALEGMAGAQAQLWSAAALSVGCRAPGLSLAQVEKAIWSEKRLVRAWCMRRTLHLLPSDDLAVYVRGTAGRAERETDWVLRHGLSPAGLTRLLDAITAGLETPATQSELAQRVSENLGSPVELRRGGGWGSRREVPWVRWEGLAVPANYLLHLVGAREVVCSGPPVGAETTNVLSERWLPRFRDVPRPKAEVELLRRYLSAFAPATPEDYARWTGLRQRDIGPIWRRVEPELAPVEVDGWQAWVLSEDLDRLVSGSSTRSVVRLLPLFDSYLLGHEDRRHLLPAEHHRRVYRNQGWVSPVLLIDGRVHGTWSHRQSGSRLRVTLRPFARLSAPHRRAVGREVEEMRRFLGASAVETLFEEPK